MGMTRVLCAGTIARPSMVWNTFRKGNSPSFFELRSVRLGGLTVKTMQAALDEVVPQVAG